MQETPARIEICNSFRYFGIHALADAPALDLTSTVLAIKAGSISAPGLFLFGHDDILMQGCLDSHTLIS